LEKSHGFKSWVAVADLSAESARDHNLQCRLLALQFFGQVQAGGAMRYEHVRQQQINLMAEPLPDLKCLRVRIGGEYLIPVFPQQFTGHFTQSGVVFDQQDGLLAVE